MTIQVTGSCILFSDSSVQTSAATATPTGTILYSTANTPPTGYVCTNAVYSQSAYPNLYACVGLLADSNFCPVHTSSTQCTTCVCLLTNGYCPCINCINTPGYCPATAYNSASYMLGNTVSTYCNFFCICGINGYPNPYSQNLCVPSNAASSGYVNTYQLVNNSPNTTWFSCTQKALYITGIEMFCCGNQNNGPFYYYYNFRTLCTASVTCPSTALCLNTTWPSFFCCPNSNNCCYFVYGNTPHRWLGNGPFRFSQSSSGPALASDRKCRAILALGPQNIFVSGNDGCNCPFSAGNSCCNFLYYFTNDGGATLKTCTNICCLTTAYLPSCSIGACFVDQTVGTCTFCNFIPMNPLAFYNAKCDNFIIFPFVGNSSITTYLSACFGFGTCTVMQSSDLICWCAAAITASICNMYCNCTSCVTWCCSVGMHCCFWLGLASCVGFVGPAGINTCYDTVSNCLWIWSSRGYAANCWIYSFDPSLCCIIGYQLPGNQHPVQVWNGCLIADSWCYLATGTPSPIECQLYIYNLSNMSSTNMVVCQYNYVPRMGYGGCPSVTPIQCSSCWFPLNQFRSGVAEFGSCNTKVGGTYFGTYGSITCDGINYFNPSCFVPGNNQIGALCCTQIPNSCFITNVIFTNQYMIIPACYWPCTGIPINSSCACEVWQWFSLYKYNSSTQFKTPNPGVAAPSGYNSFIKT